MPRFRDAEVSLISLSERVPAVSSPEWFSARERGAKRWRPSQRSDWFLDCPRDQVPSARARTESASGTGR